MAPTLFTGSANRPLAEAVAAELHVPLEPCICEPFPDGELRVEILNSVRGRDVYLVQPTSPPAETHLLELLLLADACRRSGSKRVTAVVPYFGYARQDRRGGRRTPVGARVVAELFDAAPLDRLAVIDLHTAAIEGFLAMPVEHLTAVPLLAEAARRYAGPDGVIVAPDLGAAKLADRYARILKLPVAVVHKTRVSGSEVHVTGVAGDVRGRPPIIVDDMLSTGGTIEAAVHALVQAGSLADMTVAITHGLFVGPARERLRALPVGRIIATDSVRRGPDVGLPVETVGIGPLLGEAIRRLHDDESLAPFAGG